jgi:hypothetical protein
MALLKRRSRVMHREPGGRDGQAQEGTGEVRLRLRQSSKHGARTLSPHMLDQARGT